MILCWSVSGVHRSHLGPVFWTSDAEVVRTAGLDSLARSQTCHFFCLHPSDYLAAYIE